MVVMIMEKKNEDDPVAYLIIRLWDDAVKLSQ